MSVRVQQLITTLDLPSLMVLFTSENAFTCYKLYTKETDALITLYDIGRRFVNKLPAVHKADPGIIDQMEAYEKSAPVGDGSYSSEEENRDKEEGLFNHLMSNPGVKGEEDDAPEGNDSSGEASSDEADDPDPFANFISGAANPFAGFTFNTPVFTKPVPVTQPNPGMATNNPFLTTPAPAFTTNNPFQQPTPTFGSNPGTFGANYGGGGSFGGTPGYVSPAGYGSATPGFGVQPNTGFGVAPTAYGANPNPFGGTPGALTNNPFATSPAFQATPRPVANPFVTNNPFVNQ